MDLFQDDYNFVLAAHVKPIAGMNRPGVRQAVALFVFATIKHIFLLKVKLKTQNNITTMSYNNNMSHKRLPITNNVLFRLC